MLTFIDPFRQSPGSWNGFASQSLVLYDMVGLPTPGAFGACRVGNLGWSSRVRTCLGKVLCLPCLTTLSLSN